MSPLNNLRRFPGPGERRRAATLKSRASHLFKAGPPVRRRVAGSMTTSTTAARTEGAMGSGFPVAIRGAALPAAITLWPKERRTKGLDRLLRPFSSATPLHPSLYEKKGRSRG